MAQKSRLETTQSGVAGEYFVAAELTRRGYAASLTLRNTRGIDILVANKNASKRAGIQVKTKQGSGRAWVLGAKAERDLAKNLFYVFVSLNDLDKPEYYVVPRHIVAKFVRRNHRKWLDTPGRNGKPHRDTPMRKFSDTEGKYKDKWNLLGLD